MEALLGIAGEIVLEHQGLCVIVLSGLAGGQARAMLEGLFRCRVYG